MVEKDIHILYKTVLQRTGWALAKPFLQVYSFFFQNAYASVSIVFATFAENITFR
jgi:hypothetical protein